MPCTRSRAPRSHTHRPRTAAPSRNCGVCGHAAKIARRACVPRAGRRQAVAAMRFGAGRGRRTGSCPPPPPHPPPLPPLPPALAPPPSRNRVPRGHPQGTSWQTPACPRPARQAAAVPRRALQACRRVVPRGGEGAGEAASGRRGESKAHFQAPGPRAFKTGERASPRPHAAGRRSVHSQQRALGRPAAPNQGAFAPAPPAGGRHGSYCRTPAPKGMRARSWCGPSVKRMACHGFNRRGNRQGAAGGPSTRAALRHGGRPC